MIRLIGDKFYVKSSSIKNKYYEVDRNLSCDCKGFINHGHCKHQKMVEEHILSGESVDTSRIYMGIDQATQKRNTNRPLFSSDNIFYADVNSV